MGFKLAEAFVEITSNLAPFERSLSGVHSSLDRMTQTASNVGRRIATGLMGGAAIAGTAAAVGIYKGVQAAADLGEAINLAQVTFGKSAGDVVTAADVMARAFGTSRKEFLDGAAGLGLIAKASGLAEKDAASLSIEFANLASDLSSIRNIGFDEALQKINSGLVGEAVPLRTVGVLLSEAAVKAEAARMGLKGLSEATKVQARASLIRQQLGYAKGDRAATKDSPANVKREASGRFSNALESLGQGLMPVWQELIGQVNHAMKSIGAFVEANIPTIQSWSASVSDAIQSVIVKTWDIVDTWTSFARSDMVATWANGVTTALGAVWGVLETTGGYIGAFLRNADASFQYVQTVIKQFAINLTEGLIWAMDTAAQVGSWFAGNFVDLVRDGFNGAWTIARNALTNIAELFRATWEYITNPAGGFNVNFTPMLEGFKSTVAELPKIAAPAFTSLQGELDALSEMMVGREMKRIDDIARTGAEIAGVVKPTGDGGPARTAQSYKGGEDKEKKKKSEFVGLADFAKKIQTGAFGKDKPGEDTAKNTGRMAGLMQKLVDKTGNGQNLGVAAGPA